MARTLCLTHIAGVYANTRVTTFCLEMQNISLGAKFASNEKKNLESERIENVKHLGEYVPLFKTFESREVNFDLTVSFF